MDALDDIYCLQESQPQERPHLLALLEDAHLHSVLEVSDYYLHTLELKCCRIDKLNPFQVKRQFSSRFVESTNKFTFLYRLLWIHCNIEPQPNH